MSKIITKANLVENRVPIGFSGDTPIEKTVPESQYRKLEAQVQQIAEENYRKGFSEGKEAGFNEGMAKGQAESQQIISQLQPILSEIVRQKNVLLINSEEELVHLALAIAEKIVDAVAQKDQELVKLCIKNSLPLLLEKSRLIIKVAPEQEQFLRQNLETIMGMDAELKEIKVESDRRINSGGCILESTSGRVDARLEKQLETLSTALQKEIPTSGLV